MNRKKKIILFLCYIILISLMSFGVGKALLSYQTKKFEQKNSYIIQNLLDKGVSVDDIVESYLKKGDYQIGQEVIEQYRIGIRTNEKKVYGGLFFLFLVPSMILFLYIGISNYRLKKQMNKIDEYMNQVLNGNYILDLTDYKEGLISNLKNDVYKMTVLLKEKNDALWNDKKYLEETLEDISHQLKTPLTSMYMMNDILRKDLSKKEKNEFLDKNFKQLERIEWLITSLLKMSRLDSGTVTLKKQNVKVTTLLTKAIEPIQPLMDSKGITLSLNLTNTTLQVDENWTSEALLNIIKNACEHTQDHITIASISNPIYTAISIEDNGPGISRKDLPHIFKRFYKGDHNKESIGIGLNMSKKIIQLQNGCIDVKTNEKGTTFLVKFYK